MAEVAFLFHRPLRTGTNETKVARSGQAPSPNSFFCLSAADLQAVAA
jgi:hypothetical protein